ncbi:MAG: DUF4270 family protein [Saprospirales bacterium]|nr:DUF4270 family protein [Saprospirales bacterium]
MKHTAVPHFSTLLAIFLGLLWGYSCTKPTPFGSVLLEDEIADFFYSDTLTLRCSVLPEDSVLTSDRSSTADFHFCGQLNDPVFGRSQSDIFTLFRLKSLSPDFKDATVDSIVLYLRYDAAGFYGDTTQPQTLRIHRLAPDTLLRWDADYYAHQSFPVGQQIGELVSFLPKPSTSAALFDTASKAPYLRIPLDHAFGQELLDIDSADMTADTSFWKRLRGLRISAESAGSPGAMMAFDLNNAAFSLIRLYYKQPQDTTSSIVEYNFVGGNKFAHFTHDYSASTVAPYINQAADDQLFVQGMGGLRLRVEIPYAHLLENIAVNKAELELTMLSLPGDNPLLTPAGQLVFTESIGDTTLTLTSDVLYSLGPTLNGGFTGFGGFPEMESDNGNMVERYRLTLTRRFQDMVDNQSGNVRDQTLYINVYPQSRSAQRAIFYGPRNSSYPAKLALKFTKVQ